MSGTESVHMCFTPHPDPPCSIRKPQGRPALLLCPSTCPPALLPSCGVPPLALLPSCGVPPLALLPCPSSPSAEKASPPSHCGRDAERDPAIVAECVSRRISGAERKFADHWHRQVGSHSRVATLFNWLFWCFPSRLFPV